jgi:hypothetical protein
MSSNQEYLNGVAHTKIAEVIKLIWYFLFESLKEESAWVTERWKRDYCQDSKIYVAQLSSIGDPFEQDSKRLVP